jgi:uncharacterized protein YndB with AHSA1/START domain
MTKHRAISFVADIAAPPSRVFEVMLAPESWQDWTSAFDEESRYEGTWKQGEQIRFLGPGGRGVLCEIEELRPNAYVSLRHLGLLADGAEDRTSEDARAWVGAREIYMFEAVRTGTQLEVELQVPDEFEEYFRETWPEALERLTELCEAE